MFKAKISYSKMSNDELLALAKNVVVKLNANPSFPAPPVTVTELGTLTDTYSNVMEAAANRDREKQAQLRAIKTDLTDALRTDAEYVNMVAAGNEAMLLSSGYEISKKPVKHGLPGEITKLNAGYTNISGSGSVMLSWSRSRYAKSYNVFISSNNGQTWTMFSTTYGRKLLCDALDSGTRYQFKVIPVNKAGEGPVSDVASQLAA